MKSKNSERSINGINIISLFSSNLRRLRKSANLTQADLAERADLTPNFINDIENGRKWVSAESLGKLVVALETEPQQFFATSQNWESPEKEFLSLFLSEYDRMSHDIRKRYLADNDTDLP